MCTCFKHAFSMQHTTPTRTSVENGKFTLNEATKRLGVVVPEAFAKRLMQTHEVLC